MFIAHTVYGVECPCRGLHTLVMGLSAVVKIALHWCAVIGFDNSTPKSAQNHVGLIGFERFLCTNCYN